MWGLLKIPCFFLIDSVILIIWILIFNRSLGLSGMIWILTLSSYLLLSCFWILTLSLHLLLSCFWILALSLHLLLSCWHCVIWLAFDIIPFYKKCPVTKLSLVFLPSCLLLVSPLLACLLEVSLQANPLKRIIFPTMTMTMSKFCFLTFILILIFLVKVPLLVLVV